MRSVSWFYSLGGLIWPQPGGSWLSCIGGEITGFRSAVRVICCRGGWMDGWIARATSGYAVKQQGWEHAHGCPDCAGGLRGGAGGDDRPCGRRRSLAGGHEQKLHRMRSG